MTIKSFACQIDYCSAVTLMLTEIAAVCWQTGHPGSSAGQTLGSSHFSNFQTHQWDKSYRKRIIGVGEARADWDNPWTSLATPSVPPSHASKIFWGHKRQDDPLGKGEQILCLWDFNHFSYAKVEEGRITLKCQTHNETNVLLFLIPHPKIVS